MKWVTVWGNAPSITEHRPETYAKDITLRYPVTCALGGERVRLHFSNSCGGEPVTLSRVTLARAMGDREISLHNARLVTFGGEESVCIPAGGEWRYYPQSDGNPQPCFPDGNRRGIS